MHTLGTVPMEYAPQMESTRDANADSEKTWET